MSFQKPKATEPMDIHSKPVDNQLRPECAQPTNPVLSQHSISSILPLKQINSNNPGMPNQLQAPPQPQLPQPHFPPLQNLAPDHQLQVEMQLKQKQLLEMNFRQQQLQQLQLQQSRQFRHQQFQLPPHQFNPMPLGASPQQQTPLTSAPPPQPPPPPPPQQQLQQQQQPAPVMSRLPIQVPPLPSPMRHAPPLMQPTPGHPMMTQQGPPMPLMPGPIGVATSQKLPPPPAPQQHQMSSVPSAHPLNLCRKYSEPAFVPDPVRAQGLTKTRPPMAHGAKGPKMAPLLQSRAVAEDLVLNLSAKSSTNNSSNPPEAIVKATPAAPTLETNDCPSPNLKSEPEAGPKHESDLHLNFKTDPENSTAPAEKPAEKPEILTPAVPTAAEPTKREDDLRSPETAPAPKNEPEQGGADSKTEPDQNAPPAEKPEIQAPATPERSNREENSRSPNLTASPTSPSEMVIDESADAPSPASSSDQQESSTQ